MRGLGTLDHLYPMLYQSLASRQEAGIKGNREVVFFVPVVVTMYNKIILHKLYTSGDQGWVRDFGTGLNVVAKDPPKGPLKILI